MQRESAHSNKALAWCPCSPLTAPGDVKGCGGASFGKLPSSLMLSLCLSFLKTKTDLAMYTNTSCVGRNVELSCFQGSKPFPLALPVLYLPSF